MVVLETEGMLAAGSNQYLQPDYLTPLSGTLDSKKSPLALLAQTCSQIGAESSKSLPNEKKKEGGASSGEDKKDKTPTPAEPPRRSPAFKPYESSTPRKEDSDEQTRPASSQTSSTRPASVTSNGTSAHKDDGRKSSDASSSASATPIIRPGLEVLAGHPKDVPLGTYRPGAALFPTGYPSLETHPAFRGTHPSLLHPGFSIPNLATLTSAYSGLYPSMMAATQSVIYTRVKTAGGGEVIVPVCRDPYCPGCPYSIQNNHLLQSGGACPPSCSQCEQAKAALSVVPGLSSISPSSLVPASSLLPPTTVGAAAAAVAASSIYPQSLISAAAAAAAATAPRQPITCSYYIPPDSYCGKRFNSSEEFLAHLRTHSAVSEASALSMLTSPLHSHPLFSTAAAAHSALHRPSFPPPSLSPLASAARYHPYSKPPSALTPTLSSLPPYPHTALTSAGYPPGYPPYASLYPRPGL